MSEIAGLYGNFWPSPRERDLVRFLLHVDAQEARDAWARWRPGWDPDAPNSEEYRFYPLMAERLAALSLDEPQLGMLRGVRRQYTVRNLINLDHLEGVLSSLEEAGIEGVVLKGAALVLSVYPNTGMRPLHDLDVLVDPGRHDEAIALLEKQGWFRVYHYDPGLWDHAVTLRRGEVTLDLHRRYCRELVIPGHLDLGWETTRTQIAPRPLRSGRSVRILAPTDALLHAIAHGTLALEPINLRWVADANRILAAGGVDWDRLVRLSGAFEVSPIVHDGLVFLSDITGAQIPPEPLARLRDAPLPPLAGRRMDAFHAFRAGTGVLGKVSREADRYLEHTRHQRWEEVLARAPKYAVVDVFWPRARARVAGLLR